MKKQKPYHQIKKNEILEAAEELFYNKGYRQTTISDIVSSLGMAQGAIYYYFPSKDALLDGLIKKHANIFLEHIQSIKNNKEISAQKKLENIIKSIFTNMRNRDGRLLFDFINNDPSLDFMPKLAKFFRYTIIPPIKDVVAEGQLTGELNIIHPQVGANIVFALIHMILIAIYERQDADVCLAQLPISEKLIAQALGLKDFRIHIV